MRLATFIGASGKPALGLVETEGGLLRPLEGAANPAGGMLELISRWGEIGGPAMATGRALSLSQVRLLAPIPTPHRNIFCIGKNYREHVREFSGSGFDKSGSGPDKSGDADLPEAPIVFTKAPSTVIGPGEQIFSHPGVTTSLDYEAELAVVIGRAGRAITEQAALEHVFGYTIVNDVTARDLQRRHVQWFLGKSLDTFCPMGPWIVTGDQIDSANLDISLRVNGEIRQQANTSQMIFNIPTLIATISRGITLLPGDVIATGTPSGVGAGFKPPRFLKAGDEVAITIGGIGSLSNRVA